MKKKFKRLLAELRYEFLCIFYCRYYLQSPEEEERAKAFKKFIYDSFETSIKKSQY